MKKLISSILFVIAFFSVGTASAYTHVRELPSDFHPAKCYEDKELNEYATLIVDGKTRISPKLQIVGFSHNNYINLEKDAFLPIGPIFAYVYMCSYQNNLKQIKHIWVSRIYKNSRGDVVRTFVIVPENYKSPLKYEGKTYTSWNDWYNDTFFDDEEVSNKYKNFNSLEYFDVETKEVYDRTMNFKGYNKTPLYKFRYVGSFLKGKVKYYAWETFMQPTLNSKAWLYTTKPYPPKFEDRVKWLEKSRTLY